MDPFAGGKRARHRGRALGRHYWGCDLRPEQIAANEAQAHEIRRRVRPVWVCGDSMETLADAPAADFCFRARRMATWKVYSDDPRDLSAMDWHAFVAAYNASSLRAVGRMKPDTFCVFVVGDFRDGRGVLQKLRQRRPSTASEQAGARLIQRSDSGHDD